MQLYSANVFRRSGGLCAAEHRGAAALQTVLCTVLWQRRQQEHLEPLHMETLSWEISPVCSGRDRRTLQCW